MEDNKKQLHERLWSAAEHMRANSSLKLNEISEPLLGLIFLKFADVRFQKTKGNIVSERKAVYTTSVRSVSPDDYKAQGVLFVPDHATYSHLMNLPENENLGKAVNEAMKGIEEANEDLRGVLPQDYTSLSKKVAENTPKRDCYRIT